MTTTAAAKYQNLIRAMSPSIVIVEEAAEVELLLTRFILHALMHALTS